MSVTLKIIYDDIKLIIKLILNDISSIQGPLLLIFIVLKLAGIIEWSWVWVTAPFWIPWTYLVIPILLRIIAVIFLGAYEKLVGPVNKKLVELVKSCRKITAPGKTKLLYFRQIFHDKFS